MALTIEWTRRIDNWRNEIRKHVYLPLAPLAIEGFVTAEQLSPEQAAKGKFAPMPQGTRWGAKWEYGWFRATVTVPKAGAGRRIVVAPDFGGEALVFVNGRAAAARDREHREITLTRKAKAGERFALLAEAYAGHGPQVCSSGPVPPGPRDGARARTDPGGGGGELVRDLGGGRLPARPGRGDAVPPAREARPRQPARVGDRPGAARVHHHRRLRARPRADARDRAPVPPGARAPARVRQRLHRARALRLRPRPHRRGLAVAARRDRAQGRAHARARSSP